MIGGLSTTLRVWDTQASAKGDDAIHALPAVPCGCPCCPRGLAQRQVALASLDRAYPVPHGVRALLQPWQEAAEGRGAALLPLLPVLHAQLQPGSCQELFMELFLSQSPGELFCGL